MIGCAYQHQEASRPDHRSGESEHDGGRDAASVVYVSKATQRLSGPLMTLWLCLFLKPLPNNKCRDSRVRHCVTVKRQTGTTKILKTLDNTN
jgi:hypothetical protein